MQRSLQRGCGFFDWFYEESSEDINQVLINRLESIEKELDGTKNQYEKLRARNEELGDVVSELQIQLNYMLKWKKSLKVICFVMLCVCLIKLF